MNDPGETPIEQLAIDTVRGLALDGPHAAGSGHQGTAMALAPLAHVLFTRIMTYDAAHPDWPDRDRLILSAGHASILHYAFLHLLGYEIELEDLRRFRQWGSLTPGHPEVGLTPGVEVTTGPLGQGFANAVGMAVAERHLRHRLGPDLVDHRIFAICSDGDLMEGISHEAASFAGHQRLGRLVCIYDDNRITIDGPTQLALSDDAPARFRSYGWHVIELGDRAEDLDAIEAALRDATDETGAPTLVVLRSEIATPSPTHTGDAAAHGYALGEDEIARAKAEMGLPNEPFAVPDDVLDYYRRAGRRGADAQEAWWARLADTAREFSEVAGDPIAGSLKPWPDHLPDFEPGEQMATRAASETCVRAAADVAPSIIVGAADLTGNTGTDLGDDALTLGPDRPDGRQLHYGVREHAMAAMMNGMALHGGVRPVGGTFLVFSDYLRPALRLSALSRAPVIYSFTHDSVGVGEDGPTHQPVEHVMSLRLIPDLSVIRPADATETAGAWAVALDHRGPTALVLTRQGVPTLDDTDAERVAQGAYVLRGDDEPGIVLVGTGSEVSICLAAADELAAEGIAVRVVSMPSWDRFAAQPDEYRREVLPPGVPTLSVEAGTTIGWDRYADRSVGIDRFGASAPGPTVLDELGISATNVAAQARALLADEGSAT